MPQITKDDRFAAYGMYALAREHYRKAREYEAALARRLGLHKDDGNFGMSFVADLIYEEDAPGSIEAFDDAVQKDGVMLEE